MSVGTVNSVAAVLSGGVEQRIRICRTRSAPHSINADLPFTARIQDSAAESSAQPIAGSPILPGAEVIATMASYLTAAMNSDADIVLACPAIYSVQELSGLRELLDAAGLARIVLTPEPVAAAAWLEMHCESAESASILVYDLGGGGLDVTLLRTGSDGGARIVGRPVRSSAFGGRSFSALLACYTHDLTADTTSPGLPGALPDSVVAGLRSGFVRSSVPLLHECIRTAGLTAADIDRILLIGGASRPAEVAQVLTDELRCPVVTAPDPAHCVAIGAAALAARGLGGAEFVLPPPRTGHPAKRIAALAGAAAVLAAVGVSAGYGGDPGEQTATQAQAPGVGHVAPLGPLLPDRAGEARDHVDRPASTQPHPVRWSTTGHPIGDRNSTLFAADVAASARADATLEPPHSAPGTTIVESSLSHLPPLPVQRVDTSGSGGSRTRTGEAVALPSDLAIPAVGSLRPPDAPDTFDYGTMSGPRTPIDSTTNPSGRIGVGEPVSASSTAGAGAWSHPAVSASRRSGTSAGNNSAAGASSRTSGSTASDSRAGTSNRPTGSTARGPRADAANRTGDGTKTDSGASTGSHSGTSAASRAGGNTGSHVGDRAGSDSAGSTGSRAGS
ncbi:Hsp70 family protein [Nocardia beijingensis]|uniref:Hsp70 family protein n=1 Tax=Nocardia beijingensis TaxID=95162 RepID=UPI00344CD113